MHWNKNGHVCIMAAAQSNPARCSQYRVWTGSFRGAGSPSGHCVGALEQSTEPPLVFVCKKCISIGPECACLEGNRLKKKSIKIYLLLVFLLFPSILSRLTLIPAWVKSYRVAETVDSCYKKKIMSLLHLLFVWNRCIHCQKLPLPLPWVWAGHWAWRSGGGGEGGRKGHKRGWRRRETGCRLSLLSRQ